MNEQDLKTQVALQGQESQQIKILINKLDLVIDQLQKCVSNMSGILQIHESKIETQEKAFSNFFKLAESRRIEESENQRILHQRITSAEKTLDGKISSKTNALDTELHLCEEKLSDRISSLEKWTWIAIGALAVINVIVYNLDNLATLVK